MEQLFEDLLNLCNGDIVQAKKTLIGLEGMLEAYVDNAEENNLSEKKVNEYLFTFGMSSSSLEKFYFEEAKFRLKEFHGVDNPKYDLIDEIVDSWFNEDVILNYDTMDDIIRNILSKTDILVQEV